MGLDEKALSISESRITHKNPDYGSHNQEIFELRRFGLFSEEPAEQHGGSE